MGCSNSKVEAISSPIRTKGLDCYREQWTKINHNMSDKIKYDSQHHIIQIIDMNVIDQNQCQIKQPPLPFVSNAHHHAQFIYHQDQTLCQFITSIKIFLQSETEVNYLIPKQNMLQNLQLFENCYVDENNCLNVIQFVLNVIQDSILFVNKGRKNKSLHFDQQIIGGQKYYQNVAKEFHLIHKNNYKINKYTLEQLNFASQYKKIKKDKNCYQHLAFDFSQKEIQKLVMDVKRICIQNAKPFAFLSNYLMQCCINMQNKGTNNTVFKINQKLTQIVNKLIKQTQLVTNIKIAEDLANVHKSYKQEIQNTPKLLIDLKQVELNQRETIVNKFIQQKIEQSHKNYPIFIDLVKQKCLYGHGYLFNAELSLQNINQKQKLNKLKQKPFPTEFKKYDLIPQFNKSLSALLDEEQNHYKQQMKQILESYPQFEISSLIKGFCLFSSIKNINNCTSAIINRIKEKEGFNCKILQLENRLNTDNCDMVIKIQINESICQMQLIYDKINVVNNQFNNYLHQIVNSRFFTPLSNLKNLNDQISKIYFGKLLLINEANKNIASKQVYDQKITYKMIYSQFQKFIKSLPVSIERQKYSIKSQFITQLKNKLEQIKNSHIQTQNINERIKDQDKRYKLFETNHSIESQKTIQKLCLYTKLKYPSLFQKLKDKTWDHITPSQKEQALIYAKHVNNLARVNVQIGNFQKAIHYFQINQTIYDEHVLNQKQQYASTLHQLGRGQYELVNYAKSLSYLKRSLILQQSLPDKDQTIIAIMLEQIGNVYKIQKNYKKVIQYYQNSLEIQQKMYAKGCIQSVCNLINIGLANFYQSKSNQAIQYFQTAMKIQIKVKEQICITNAVILNLMGMAQLNSEKALEYFQRSIKYYEQIKGKGGNQVCQILKNICILFLRNFGIQESQKYFKQCLEIQSQKCIKYAHILQLVAQCQDEFNLQKYLQYYKLCLKMYQNMNGKDCHERAIIFMNLGVKYDRKQIYEQAIKYYELSLQIYQNNNHTFDKNYAKIHQNLGSIYKRMKDDFKSEEYYRKWNQIDKQLNKCNYIKRTLYKDRNNYDEDILQAKNYFQFISDKNNIVEADQIFNKGINYYNIKDYANAISNFVNLEEKITINTDSIKYQKCLNYLLKCYTQTGNIIKINEYEEKKYALFYR